MEKKKQAVLGKEEFWQLIEKAKCRCGQDKKKFLGYIRKELRKRGPEVALCFHSMVYVYRQLAYKYGLWTAAGIMLDGCSDDGFLDFRAWLIAQGKDVFLEALRCPDSLAKVEVYGDCEFESFSYVGSVVYEKLTGRDAYADMDSMEKELRVELKKDIEYAALIEYPYEIEEALIVFPELIKKHLTEADIQYQSRHPTWNTNIAEIRQLLEEGRRKMDELKGKELQKKKKHEPKCR